MKSDCSKSELFFHQYINNQKRIYAYILMLVPNVTDADDILQQVSSFMWERFDSFTPGTNFGAWAVKISRNVIFNHYKRKCRAKVIFSDNMLELFADKAAETVDHIDERMSLLHKCLNELQSTDRKLIKIRYEEGLKIKDIAEQIDRPVGGLYKAINRIHNSLLMCIRRKMITQETA